MRDGDSNYSDWHLIRKSPRKAFDGAVVVYDACGLVKNKGHHGVIGRGGMGLKMKSMNLEFGQEVTIEFVNDKMELNFMIRASVANSCVSDDENLVGFEFLALSESTQQIIDEMVRTKDLE